MWLQHEGILLACMLTLFPEGLPAAESGLGLAWCHLSFGLYSMHAQLVNTHLLRPVAPTHAPCLPWPQVNGKKLIPNSTVLLKFMAPLVLWAAAVVVVFGVSFTMLANLQGPLSSLNAAAHVTYRVSRVRLLGELTGMGHGAFGMVAALHVHANQCTHCADRLRTLVTSCCQKDHAIICTRRQLFGIFRDSS